MSTATAMSSDQDDVTPSTTDLLRRAAEGDQRAWEGIVRRYSAVVYARVRSFRLQDADALDAMQMTWLRLAENLDRIRCPEGLAGWLGITATRECIRIFRQGKRTAAAAESTWANTADPSVGPEQQAVDAATAQLLRSLVADLSPRQRIVVQELFAATPTPYAEVARTAGIPIGGVGPTRARALEELRRRLDEHGLGRGGDRSRPVPALRRQAAVAAG